MPIYEYACKHCHSTFETLVLNSAEEVRCPQCQGQQLEKLISAHSVGGSHDEPACKVPACGMNPDACCACQ
jgi:putative FmdB family regulatory protein